MTTVFKIYYTDKDGTPKSTDEDSLTRALTMSEQLRKAGYSFVTMVSENTDLVGRQGVSSVSDGKLPNGEAYEYTKRDALSQRLKKDAPTVGTDEVIVMLDDE